MGQVLQCVSPIDGSVYAEREVLSREAAFEAAGRARAVQAAWAGRPLQERIDLVMAGVAAVGAMNEEIVPELAHMMGRPVRYGGEIGGFNERASHMAEIAEGALADIAVGEDEVFERYIRRIPHGVVFVVAPWNYPYMTAINTVAPALIAGNTVILKYATQTLQVGERMARAFRAAGVPEDVFQNVFLRHDVTHDMWVMRDESFGPVVGIMKVSSDEDAIALMNDSAFGLTASLWTRDVDRAVRVGDAIETGTVILNRADYLDPGLCWTGCKNTGRGGGLSVIGYHNLTRPKSYHLKKVTL